MTASAERKRPISGFPGSRFASPRTGSDAAVHVHEADGVELLVAGKAARDLLPLPLIRGRGETRGVEVGRPVHPGSSPGQAFSALAPEPAPDLIRGVEAQAFEHGATRIGDHVERAEVVLQEVARLGGRRHARRGFRIDHNRRAGHTRRVTDPADEITASNAPPAT